MSSRQRGGDLLDKLSFDGVPERVKKEILPFITLNISEDVYRGLTEEDKDFLNNRAQEIAGRLVRTIQDQIAVARALSEAQNRFSNHRNGNFVKWYESIGLKKDYVYTLLNKTKIYEKFGRHLENRILRDSTIEISEGVQERVFKLPEKAVRMVSSYTLKERDDKLDRGEVIEILIASSPVKKASEIIKNKFSEENSQMEGILTKDKALEAIQLLLEDVDAETCEEPNKFLEEIKNILLKIKRG